MKLIWVACFLLICGFAFSSLSAESYWNLSLNSNGENPATPEKDNPIEMSESYIDDLRMSYFMALVPGFVVHGAGNFYGGRTGTGLTLLSLELVSIYGILRTEWHGWMGNTNSEDDKNDIIKVGSLILFFGTWIYDIVTVDSAIKDKYEDKKVRISFLSPAKTSNEQRSYVMLLNLSIDF